MNPWIVLEVNPTDDESVIKKAYASKLRAHHPEDDPEGYQIIREAYDAAMKSARILRETNRSASIPEVSGHALDSDDLPQIVISEEEPVNQSLSAEVVDFLNQLESLYNDFFSRVNNENWKVLLNKDILWSITDRQILALYILDFLSSHHFLPSEIWRLLDDHFSWCDSENPIYYRHFPGLIEYIRKQKNDQKPCNYSFGKTDAAVDFERYLLYRENAYMAYAENNLADAGVFVDKAKRIYLGDPELLLIEGKISLKSNNTDEAINIFSQILHGNPNEKEALLCRLIAHFEKGQDIQFRNDYKQLFGQNLIESELPLFIAKTFYKFEDNEKAKKWIDIAYAVKKPEKEVKTLRAQIYARIKVNLKTRLENDPTNAELKQELLALEFEEIHSAKPVDIKKALKKALPYVIYIIVLVLLKLIDFI
ncbi:MAG: hypothetical protein AAGU75_06500 [Bacillota bacterium]